MKKIISFFVLVIFAFSFSACTNNQATTAGTSKSSDATGTKAQATATVTATPAATAALEPTAIPALELSASAAEIHTSETLKLSVGNFDGKIAWASSDPYVAAVDGNGVVTGMHKAGVAQITAKAGDKTLACTVTNSVVLHDISAKELVSKIKIGSDFSSMDNIDFSFKIGYDDYENSSSRIYIDLYFGAAGIPGDYGCRGTDMRKGDTIHQTISLDSLKDCDPSLKLSRAGISAFYHGSGNYNGKVTIKVSNAKIKVGSKVYNLDYLNGTNTLDMIANYEKDYDTWVCYNKIGDTFDSGLPTAADLKGGVFEADMTIVDVNETNRPDKVAYYLTNGNMLAPPKREMIDALKDAGYDAVRLTISYTPFMNNDTFVIDKAWMDKVEEAVNWVLADNMYCIIDSHSDFMGLSWVGDHWSNAWMIPKYQSYVDARFTAMWKQIADRFKDYDDTLLFEAMNEPGMPGNASESEEGKPDTSFKVQADRVNDLNNIFYSIVQSSGGNNPKRFLLFPCVYETYNSLDALKLPDSNKIIATVHTYFFDKGNGKFTDTCSDKQASYDDVVAKDLKQVEAFMKKTGVPVIIGEFGNTEETENSARIAQATSLVEKAAAIGVPCFWWECGVSSDNINERFGFYNFKTLSWAHQDILQAIIAAAKNR